MALVLQEFQPGVRGWFPASSKKNHEHAQIIRIIRKEKMS